jgi:hypothetical protein
MGITDKKQVERHLGRSVGTSVGFSKNRKFGLNLALKSTARKTSFHKWLMMRVLFGIELI